MEPFKNLLNPALVGAAAAHLQRAWPAFEARRFEALATQGLEALELKARAQHITAALQATLPADFARAADIIEASLAPPRPAADGLTNASPDGSAWPAGSSGPWASLSPGTACSSLSAR